MTKIEFYVSSFQLVETSNPVTKSIDKSFYQCVGTGSDWKSI